MAKRTRKKPAASRPARPPAAHPRAEGAGAGSGAPPPPGPAADAGMAVPPASGATPPGPGPSPSAQVAPGSFLPSRVAGRAQRRRQAEAQLTPLDDSPAIPLDRVPLIGSDLRRIAGVALVMIALLVVGLVIFR